MLPEIEDQPDGAMGGVFREGNPLGNREGFEGSSSDRRILVEWSCEIADQNGIGQEIALVIREIQQGKSHGLDIVVETPNHRMGPELWLGRTDPGH